VLWGSLGVQGGERTKEKAAVTGGNRMKRTLVGDCGNERQPVLPNTNSRDGEKRNRTSGKQAVTIPG